MKTKSTPQTRALAARANLLASNAALQAAFAGNDKAAMNAAIERLQADVRRVRKVLKAS
jgi:hypothetical protein